MQDTFCLRREQRIESKRAVSWPHLQVEQPRQGGRMRGSWGAYKIAAEPIWLVQ